MSSGWAAWLVVGEMMYFGFGVEDAEAVEGSSETEDDWGLFGWTPTPTPEVDGGRVLGMGL